MEGDQLFLMEFLIDKVNIPAIRAIHEDILPTKTCVSFQILDLPPLNVYQEMPAEACACIDSEEQIFKKGKSCLFALPNAVLQKPLCTFPVTVSVYKELPPGVLPDVMLIGTHQIQTRDLINSLLSQQIFKTGNACRTIKDTFKITTATGQCVGEVTIFIRASCFGRKIVTQFQIPHNRKPYLFKGVDDGPVFQCKRVSSVSDREKITCVCPAKRISGDAKRTARSCCPAVIERQKDCQDENTKDKRLPYSRDIVRKKESVRKCGCAVEERNCICTGTSLQN